MSRLTSLSHWRKPSPVLGFSFQMSKFNYFDNFLFLDFESTCENKTKIKNQEIIEFPCVWTDSNFSPLSTYHRYVKPIYNPILTPYCVQLTGILQEMVQKEEVFDKVMVDFLTWLEGMENSVGKDKRNTFVTCGDWDLKTMLPEQCKLSRLLLPKQMSQWLNLKKVFMETTGYYPKSLKDMRKYLGITPIGREHSGIDDCHNMIHICKILKMRYGVKQIQHSSG